MQTRIIFTNSFQGFRMRKKERKEREKKKEGSQ